MKPLALTCVVVLCASVVQAAPIGTTYVYNFDGLTQYSPLWMNTDGVVQWSSTVSNNGIVSVVPGGKYAGDKLARTNATGAEELVSSLTNYPGTLFPGLDSSNTQFRFTADSHINYRCGWLLGIWVDGINALPNTTTNNQSEFLVQMGMTHVSMNWRVRGANGLNSTVGGTPPTSAYLESDDCYMRLILDFDIAADGGNGVMSFSAMNIASGVVDAPAALQNVSIGLLAQNAMFADPANWTGFYVRNQRLVGGDSPGNGIGYHTVDNLTLEVTPEPATMSLLVLGGLACLRRRR